MSGDIRLHPLYAMKAYRGCKLYLYLSSPSFDFAFPIYFTLGINATASLTNLSLTFILERVSVFRDVPLVTFLAALLYILSAILPVSIQRPTFWLLSGHATFMVPFSISTTVWGKYYLIRYPFWISSNVSYFHSFDITLCHWTCNSDRNTRFYFKYKDTT